MVGLILVCSVDSFFGFEGERADILLLLRRWLRGRAYHSNVILVCVIGDVCVYVRDASDSEINGYAKNCCSKTTSNLPSCSRKTVGPRV